MYRWRKSIQSQYDSQLFLSQQKDLEHVLQLKHHGYMTAYYTSYHGHYYYIGMTGLTDWEDQDQDLYAVVIGMEDQAHIDSLMVQQYFEDNWGLFFRSILYCHMYITIGVMDNQQTYSSIRKSSIKN